MDNHTAISKLLIRLKELRKSAKISRSELEKQLMLGPGWINKIETGEVIPSINTLLAILNNIGADLSAFTKGIDITHCVEIDRKITSEESSEGLIIQFPYGKFDAEYLIRNATQRQFSYVQKQLRNGLARLAGCGNVNSLKTEAVARAFLAAIRLWPDVNPSDIWWFIISRAYNDPFNHPAEFSRLDLAQSWKRTSGWAFEEILVRHYSRHLRKSGVNLCIATGDRKTRLVRQLENNVDDRIEADKVDLFLTGKIKGKEQCFGVVHVKASFAERRTDDVPLSRSLINAGYVSPLCTMDCKSMPAKNPHNKGELGMNWSGSGNDRRSAKRRDIEDDGYFSACFSYNQNTNPTPKEYRKSKAMIHVCNFRNPNDVFVRFLLGGWNKFKSKEG